VKEPGSTTGRRFVVVVRAGETSLHAGWLKGDRRNWDLVVSWYGTSPYEPIADEVVVNVQGGVGDGYYKTFAALPGLIDAYDFFWLPDDDIAIDCATINRLFEVAAAEDLPVCQPALTHDSYFSHPHTLASASFRLRYTSLVEVMAPCLSRARLKAMLPWFRDNAFCAGLDWVWTRLEADNRRRGAIIDETIMRHTRPVGVFLRERIPLARGERKHGREREILEHFGLPGRDRGFKCYAGISRKDGRQYGPLAVRLLMARDYFREAGSWVQPKTGQRIARMFLRRNAALSQVKAADPHVSPECAGSRPGRAALPDGPEAVK
jgi:hypothetical protein